MNGETIRAAVLGAAVGDALGVPVEFRDRAKLRANPVKGMRAFGTHDQPAGTWSDDTSMLLATLDSLLEGYDPEDIMARFERWLMRGEYTPYGEVFDRGMIVTQAVARYRAGERAVDCGGAGPRDNGNGSLMRIMPVCLYAISSMNAGRMDQAEAVGMIHEVSGLTHAHVISKAGCGIYFFLVKSLTGEQPGTLPEKLQRGVDSAFAHYRQWDWYNYEDALSAYDRLCDLEAFKGTDEALIGSGGYVVETLEAAIWCLLNTDDLEAALLKAVNLGRDTDTVAAVAGGLAGLYYGADAIPAAWLDVQARRAWIESLCDQAASKW